MHRVLLAFVLLALGCALGCDAAQEAEPAPAAPQGLASPTSRVLDGPVHLSWQALADAGTYEVEVARELAGRLDTVRATVSAPTFTADLGAGAYRWRVRGVRLGVPTAWSATATFRIDRAVADVAVRWTLPTATYAPSETYVLEPEAPVSLLGRLEGLGLDASLVLGIQIDGIELALVQPQGAPLDAFADYQIFPAGGSVIASLLSPPAAPHAEMDLLNAGLPLAVLSSPVVYRLRTATTATVPAASPFVLEATTGVLFLLDVRTPLA